MSERDALAKVVGQHRLVRVTGGTSTGSRWICECGAEEINPGTRAHALRMHSRHVAARLAFALAERDRRVKAEAWREGHAAGREYQGDGWNQDAHDPERDNPYAEPIEGER